MENIRFHSKSNLPLVAAEIFAIIYQGRVVRFFSSRRARSC